MSGITAASMSSSSALCGVSALTFEKHSELIRCVLCFFVCEKRFILFLRSFFLFAHRYPNSMSNLRRLRCYLMACQHHNFDYSKHLDGLVSKDVAEALRTHPVIFPDENSVYLAIGTLGMNMAPFEELNKFRVSCFSGFASHQKKNLSLTDVLKLYVAAYQARSIWKQLWMKIYPVISPQITRDVEKFCSSVPFAVEPFVHILKTSSPFSGGL